MHSADLHNDYHLSKLKVLDFSDDCCRLSTILDLYLLLRILKSGDELIIVTMRRQTQRFGNEHYMSNYVLRGSYFMSMQSSSLLSNFKFGDDQTSWVRDMTRGHSFPTFQSIDISPHLSVKQDSQNTIFFQWRTLEDFLASTFDLLQQDYLANSIPERGIVITRRHRDTTVGAKEEDK